ncbi:hypothetical protein VCHC52A1_2582, partial [Vibrio cholerae HC-52A1]
MRLGKHP